MKIYLPPIGFFHGDSGGERNCEKGGEKRFGLENNFFLNANFRHILAVRQDG